MMIWNRECIEICKDSRHVKKKIWFSKDINANRWYQILLTDFQIYNEAFDLWSILIMIYELLYITRMHIWVLFKNIITVLYWELHTFMVWVDLNASIMPNYKVARGICGGFMNYAPWKIEIWTFSNHKQRFSKKVYYSCDERE